MKFEPYIIEIPKGRRFLIATEQAKIWYDPLETAQRIELEWLIENVDFGKGRRFLDGGCHHGYYSVVLYDGCEILGVDVHDRNLDILSVNAALNGFGMYSCHCAIAPRSGYTFYNGQQLGALTDDSSVKVVCATLQDIMPDANIIKLDIEGCEFEVVEESIDKMPLCDTWIVEMHPGYHKPDTARNLMEHTLNSFWTRDYELYWINRGLGDQAVVEPYPIKGGEWTMQSTVIAVQ